MGNIKQTISHRTGDEKQLVRAVNGVLVVINNRNSIYVRDARQSIKINRAMGNMRGTYPQWKLFREKLLRRKTLTMGAVMKLAVHYGLVISTARDFPGIAEANFKKEADPDEKPIANRI